MDILAGVWGFFAVVVWIISLIAVLRGSSGCAGLIAGFFLGLLGPIGLVIIIVYLYALESSSNDIPTQSGQQKMQ